MTVHEAKRDARSRMDAAGVKYDRITAETISFSDLLRCRAIFVKIHNMVWSGTAGELRSKVFADVSKPSEGGYIVEFYGVKQEDN